LILEANPSHQWCQRGELVKEFLKYYEQKAQIPSVAALFASISAFLFFFPRCNADANGPQIGSWRLAPSVFIVRFITANAS
jgi:hypothetical protein